MTYQPPPPPPPGAGGPPAKLDPKSVNPLDWGIVGAGVLAFLFSFISYYTASVDVSGSCPAGIATAADSRSESASAWHEIFGGGFFGWFAMLFAIAGAALVAISIFAPQTKLPVAPRLGGLGLFAAATVFEIIAIFVKPGDSYSQSFGGCTIEAGVGHGFGFWASLLVIIAGLALSLVRFQSTGGKLPGNLDSKVPNVGGYDKHPGVNGPQQGQVGGYGQQPPPPPPGGSAPPPPPPGYGPPQ